MAQFRFRWHSLRFWVLSGVAAFLVWLKNQIVHTSVVAELVKEGLHYVVYLMTLHKTQVASPSGHVKALDRKPRGRSRQKKR